MAKLYRPYCTIPEVRNYIRNREVEDSIIIPAINLASRGIDKMARKDFWYHTYGSSNPYVLEEYDVGINAVFLPFPIINLSSVNIDRKKEDRTNYSFKPATIYPKGSDFIKFSDVSLYSEDGTPYEVSVSGNFGYEVSSDTEVPTSTRFPAAIRRAAIVIAAVFTNDSRREEVMLDGSRASLLEKDIPEEAKKLVGSEARQVF